MANGDGFIWKVIISIVVPTLFFIGTNVIANDKSSRDRDEEIQCKMAEICKDQNKVNTEILVALSEIKSDVKYLRKAESK